jgi:3-phosphoshikimate 1-carboxyvinyltransferase
VSTSDSAAVRRIAVRGPLRGEVTVPGDKSISHRSLLLNAIAGGTARIRGLLGSADVAATQRATERMGAVFRREGDDLVIVGPDRLREPSDVLDCGNAGTTMRLLCGVVAAEPFFTVLTGDGSLRERPMGRVARPLRAMGARIDGRSGGDRAPLAVRGGGLSPMRHDLEIASAQVKSALLLAGRHVGVAVREPATSRDHTERMLRAMGASVTTSTDGWIALAPGAALRPIDVDVPGDPSSAAFWLVAASIVPNSELRLRGVGVNPTRTGVIDALRLMGAQIDIEPTPWAGAEPVADLVVRSASLHGARIDGALALRALDELPVLAVAAAFASGTTVIADAEELRVKESDRVARVVAGLRALGVRAEERPDGMVIEGGVAPPAGVPRIDARGDHRIAMAFTVAAAAAGTPIELVDAEQVQTSYPNFFADLEALGAHLHRD